MANLGRAGDAVAYRLAALHLRKNVRSRRKADAKELAHLDISKVKALIGYAPTVELDEILERVIEYFRSRE